MSVSLAPLLLRLLQHVSTVQSSMPTQKGEHWFFFSLDNKAWPTWVLACVRLLPLSLLVVHTDLRRAHQNSKCLNTAVDVFRKKWPNSLWLMPFSASAHAGWLITKSDIQSGQTGGWSKDWETNHSRHQQELWSIKRSPFRTQLDFGRFFLTVSHLEGQWQ